MDIPLSSDALDLALHPSPSTNLLAVGLISGKVQLLDLTRYQQDLQISKQAGRRSGGAGAGTTKKQKRRSGGADSDEGEGGKGIGKERRLYEKKWTTRFNSKSCRGVEFNHDGSQLWSLSKDGTLYSLDTSTSSVIQSYPGAHASAPSRLLPLPGDPYLLVTGDDEGVVNLWDTRFKSTSGDAGGTNVGKSRSDSKPVRSYNHHFDWITDFHYSRHLLPPKISKEQKAKLERERKEREERKRKRREKKIRRRGRDGSDEESAEEEEESQVATPARERLVCTSGDGSLSVIDLRAGGRNSGKDVSAVAGSNPLPHGVEVSDDQEDELLSITSVKNGGKLVVGTQLGLLSLWAPSRGLLDHIDRIPGHPASIDTLLPLDDSTILTGSSDGLIRVVQILPHKFLGVVADHGMGLPVERMKRKEGLLVSCGHGGEVKVTDIGGLLDDDDDDDDDDDSSDNGNDQQEEDAEALARRVEGDDEEQEEEEGQEAGMEHEEDAEGTDDDDGSESSSSSSSSSTPPPRPLTKKERQRLVTLSAGGPQRQEKEANDFFADL